MTELVGVTYSYLADLRGLLESQEKIELFLL